MSTLNKQPIVTLLRLSIFIGIFTLIVKTGLLAKFALPFFVGGVIGGIIVLGTALVLRKRNKKLTEFDNYQLYFQSGRIAYYLLIATAVIYVIVAGIALALGDYPPVFSFVFIPLAVFACGIAALRLHIELYREKIRQRNLASLENLPPAAVIARQRNIRRRMIGLFIFMFLFVWEASLVAGLMDRIETSQRAAKLITLQTTVTSIERAMHNHSEPLVSLQHRLELAQQELKSL